MSSPRVAVIVPCRAGESSALTLDTLSRQTFKSFDVHVVYDHYGAGAPWARNQGLQYASKNEYVLFSDADIRWEPTALHCMVEALDGASGADQGNWTTGYAYGSYFLEYAKSKMVGPIGARNWVYGDLVQQNFVSTMSLISMRSLARLGPRPWDESLKRLQDWDLWLNLALTEGIRGIYTDEVLFSTPVRQGISFANQEMREHNDNGNAASYNAAWVTVRAKWGL